MLSFGKPYHFDYFLDEHQLEWAQEEKDLGVWLSSDLKSTRHCDMVYKRALNILGILKHPLQVHCEHFSNRHEDILDAVDGIRYPGLVSLVEEGQRTSGQNQSPSNQDGKGVEALVLQRTHGICEHAGFPSQCDKS